MSSILVKSLCVLYLDFHFINQASLSSTLVHIVDTYICGFCWFQLSVFSRSFLLIIISVLLSCLSETVTVNALASRYQP